MPAVEMTRNADGSVLLGGVDSARVGEIAAAAGCVLHQLATRTASLEDAFFEATRASSEYRAQVPTDGPRAGGRTVIDALRYEGVRLRTIASTYWTLLVGVALCGLVALGFGLETRGHRSRPGRGDVHAHRRRRGSAVSRAGHGDRGDRHPVDRTRVPLPDDLPDLDRAAATLGAAGRQGADRRVPGRRRRGDRDRDLLVGGLARPARAPPPVRRAGPAGDRRLRAPGDPVRRPRREPRTAHPLDPGGAGHPADHSPGGRAGHLRAVRSGGARLARRCRRSPPVRRRHAAGGDRRRQRRPCGRWEGGAVFAGFVAVLLAVGWILFERRDA